MLNDSVACGSECSECNTFHLMTFYLGMFWKITYCWAIFEKSKLRIEKESEEIVRIWNEHATFISCLVYSLHNFVSQTLWALKIIPQQNVQYSFLQIMIMIPTSTTLYSWKL